MQIACEEERPHIVVDNTHVRDWEWRGCVQLAARHHYLLLLVEPDTAWRRDPRQLALRNIHNVPEEQIRYAGSPDAARCSACFPFTR